MQIVESFEDLQRQVSAVRSLRLGFVTNFFPDPITNSLWIKQGDCFAERVNCTLFIIKRSPSFWNVFFCSISLDILGTDFDTFCAQHAAETLIFDIVGHDAQCKPMVELFKAKGCKEMASLVRMTRMSIPLEYTPDTSIRSATEADLPEISKLLHQSFDVRTERIPYDEELRGFMELGHVLVCEEDGELVGFLIFEMNAFSLYFRYWFTKPGYRNRKVGSRLFRRAFEEGKDTKRQLLWVIRSNENAIMRYRHYSFAEENMFDYVMGYNV